MNTLCIILGILVWLGCIMPAYVLTRKEVRREREREREGTGAKWDKRDRFVCLFVSFLLAPAMLLACILMNVKYIIGPYLDKLLDNWDDKAEW